jgi:glycerophosphoryl diester phosphodiesterase
MLESMRFIPQFFSQLLRGCPGRRAFDLRDTSPLVVGHRGSPCVEIENTIPSFARALEVERAHGIELDLCLTSDGEVIVWHDWDPDASTALARVACLEPDVRCHPVMPTDDRIRRRISSLTLAEVRSHFGYADSHSGDSRLECTIPTFEELMEWAARQRSMEILFLDIKIPADELDAVPRLMSRVLAVLDRERPRFQVIFETMEPEVLEAMKRFAPDRSYTLDVQLPNGLVLRPGRFSPIAAARHYGNGFATLMYPRAVIAPWSTYRRLVRHDMKRLAAARQGDRRVRLFCFTVNDRAHISCLLRLGVDGIQTDRPGQMAEVLRELREADPRAVAGEYPAGAWET